MKLKVGDIIIENDGIVTLVYRIIKVVGNKAIGESEFQGKAYHTAYKARYFDKEHIRPFAKATFNDLTIRRLAEKI